jgi:hypothetical protein
MQAYMACSAQRESKKIHTSFWLETLNRSLTRHGRKWKDMPSQETSVFRDGLDQTGSEQEPTAGFREQGNEP